MYVIPPDIISVSHVYNNNAEVYRSFRPQKKASAPHPSGTGQGDETGGWGRGMEQGDGAYLLRISPCLIIMNVSTTQFNQLIPTEHL